MTVEELIKEEIRTRGPITFEKFMEMALYLPGYGYYTKEKLVFGRSGDYYTASHLGRLFGYVMAMQIKEFFHLSCDGLFTIVEAGAGLGLTALHILEYLQENEREVFDRLRYVIIELNPLLREIQRQRLECFGRVVWEESLEKVPPFCGVFFSNEFFDALPVRIVEQRRGLREVLVGLSGDSFIELERDAEEDLIRYFEDLSILPKEGQRTEVNMRMRDFLRTLSEKMEKGFVLTVDYGLSAREYVSEERKRGTLLCYFRHTFHDNPYVHVGEQDITAHVNFSALKVWGEEVSMKTIGYAPLCLYLLSCGILEVYGKMKSAGLKERLEMKTLLFPEGFGESHKVMVQYKGKGHPRLRGFTFKNLSESL